MSAAALANRYFQLRFYVPGMLVINFGAFSIADHIERHGHPDEIYGRFGIAAFLTVYVTLVSLMKVIIARLLRFKDRWLSVAAILSVLIDVISLTVLFKMVVDPSFNGDIGMVTPLALLVFCWVPGVCALTLARLIVHRSVRKHHG